MNSRAHADGDTVRTHAIQKYIQTVVSKFFILPSGFKSDLCAFPLQIFDIISEENVYTVPNIKI